MAYEFGQCTNFGGRLAHENMLLAIQALAENNGWETLRYVNAGDNHELILKGEGLSGQEEIFVGFRCYHSVSLDYYNIAFATMIGYVPSNSFATQPGFRQSGVPAHNTLIDYILQINPQQISVAMLVGAGVCETGHVGKCFQYTMPTAWRNALVCGGMLSGDAAVRFSDESVNHDFWARGNHNRMGVRMPSGNWVNPEVYPFNNNMLAAGTTAAYLQGRPTAAGYSRYPLEVMATNGVLGYLDGWYQVTGFDNVLLRVQQEGGSYVVDADGKSTEEVVGEIIDDAGGRAFVVLRSAFRTGFNDYIALEMR